MRDAKCEQIAHCLPWLHLGPLKVHFSPVKQFELKSFHNSAPPVLTFPIKCALFKLFSGLKTGWQNFDASRILETSK